MATYEGWRLTEHAYARWCERAWPASFEAVREYLLTPERVSAIRLGANRIHMRPDGVTLVIQDRKIVTVLPYRALVRWGEKAQEQSTAQIERAAHQ